MKREGVRFQFDEYQCADIRGIHQEIPAGIGFVYEGDTVTVVVDHRRFELDVNTFVQMKLTGAATKV